MDADEGLNHSKRLRHFKTLGPYIRELECQENCYLFDCFALCVNAKIEPSKREFWGWFMKLRLDDRCFFYDYNFGLYTTEGQWVAKEIPGKKSKEVERTLNDFYRRLHEKIMEFGLDLKPAPSLDGAKVIQAA